jgi:hypothetical protein
METNFNFKSQICTDKIQSERLLSLGLKKETADMCWIPLSDGRCVLGLSTEIRLDIIPAWSLHRLIEMVAGGSEEQMIFLPDPYDELIEEIAGAIIVGCFPKEYLV